NTLNNNKRTLSIAESVTGGTLYISITQESGVSSFYAGSITAYATESKVNVLGVDSHLIEKHSVVSAEVAKAMAEGGSRLYKTDNALAATVEAGGTKEEREAERGMVC